MPLNWMKIVLMKYLKSGIDMSRDSSIKNEKEKEILKNGLRILARIIAREEAKKQFKEKEKLFIYSSKKQLLQQRYIIS